MTTRRSGARSPRKATRGFGAERRATLAQEAARLMLDHGIGDFGLAKRKAAERLGVRDAGLLPSNAEVEASLAERQRIFAPEQGDRRQDALRRVAVDVMAELEEFRPRLVGPVLAGTATPATAVELHVFADSPEQVAAALAVGRGRAVRNCQRRYRFGSQEPVVEVPGFVFAHDGADVEVLVFPERGAQHAPLSPVDRRPMRRAARDAVLALLARG